MMPARSRKTPELLNGAASGAVMGNDNTQHALDMLNERLYRVETEVDSLKSDFADHRVAVAKLTEQVAAHETRGAERHQQVLGAIGDLKLDYRTLMQQQAKDTSERMALYGKIALGVLGILSTIVAGIYGMTPSKSTQTQPAVAAPAANHEP